MSGAGPLSALETAAAIRAGTTTALKVTEAALEAIARIDPQVNSFTAVTRERALAEARAIDARRTAGEALPPLAGVPYAVKNLFDVQGLTTLAGSKVNADLPPAAHDAALVTRMHAAGGVLTGALNMDEYAYGFTTENTHYGFTHNPHDLMRTAGGSSGGSGAAVAARLVPITLASDTNGSIRVPSSFNGVWGLKPTFGRLTRTGAFPFVPTLDQLGPMAATLPDLAAAYDAMQGPDASDLSCAQRSVELATPQLAQGIEGLRIGRLGGWFEEWLTPAARDAVDSVCNALQVTRTIDLPSAQLGRAAAFIVTASEGGALHLPNLRTRYDDFEPLSRDRFMMGALMPAAWYLKAQRVRAWYREQVAAMFKDVDVVIAAATPCPATVLGEDWLEIGGKRLPLRPSMGVLAQPISSIGLPVVVAPIPRAGGMPMGVQLIAAPWREDLCFRVAAALAARGVAASPLPAVHA